MKNPVSLTLACLLCFTSVATAAELSRSDRSFFEKAAKSGMAEVAISNGVMGRLTLPDVKNFAQTMLSDHGKANGELEALASKKAVALPPKDKSTVELSEKWGKKGKDADKDYVNQMVDDHEEAVKLFRDATKSADVDISAFAMKTLPALEHHLEMAKSLKKTVK